MSQENPTLKFSKLTSTKVLELLNHKAIDAQWDVNNAKSPKGKRDAQEELDLFASAVEIFKQPARTINLNINKLVEKIDVRTFSHVNASEQITQVLLKAVRDAELGLDGKGGGE